MRKDIEKLILEDPTLYNLGLAECKNLVLEYQKTKDPKIFSTLLARFEGTLVKTITECKKKIRYLRNEPLQELYHTSIIGFTKAIISFPENFYAELLPKRIHSYIMGELKQVYKYKINEIDIGKTSELMGELQKISDKNYLKELDELSVNMLMSSNLLNEKEKEELKERYLNNLELKEIAKKEKCVVSTIHFHLKKIINKLQEKLKWYEK